MQRPVKPNRHKQNNQNNMEVENNIKRRKSNNKENKKKSTSKSKDIRPTLKQNDINKDDLEQKIKTIQTKNSTSIESDDKVETIEKKRQYFKGTSSNMIGYITSFLSISDCFKIIKLDKRVRNLILTRHRFFPLFIQLKKLKSLTFDKIFENTRNRFPHCTRLDVLKADLIGDQLQEKETEILLSEFLYSIAKEKTIHIIESSDNFMKYLKLFLSHPKCSVSTIRFYAHYQNIYSDIGEILAFNTSVHSLEIFYFDLTIENVNKLIEPLSKNKCLKKLHIQTDFTRFPTARVDLCDSFRLFINIFNANSSVDELILDNFNIDAKVSLVLSKFVKENKTIKSLALKNCLLKDTNDIFKDCFRSNNTLESLSFEGSHFKSTNLGNLVKDLTFTRKTNKKNRSLPVVSNLMHLSFNGCYLKEKELEMVTQIIEGNPKIQSLDLGYNIFRDLCFPFILSMFKNNKSLKKLKLCNSWLKDHQFNSILEALLLNNTLESVNLGENAFSCSYNQISEFFKVNKSLKEFVIKGNIANYDAEKFLELIMLQNEIQGLKLN